MRASSITFALVGSALTAFGCGHQDSPRYSWPVEAQTDWNLGYCFGQVRQYGRGAPARYHDAVGLVVARDTQLQPFAAAV